MTKAGTINTQPVKMFRERIRSVGISLLGGNSGVEGPYELGIDEIRAVNEEDVTVKPSMSIIVSSMYSTFYTIFQWTIQRCGDQYESRLQIHPVCFVRGLNRSRIMKC
jgi:hypothetical protein